eukprot:scaffold158686_cov37-Tisochrysis_lutea.AAC.2
MTLGRPAKPRLIPPSRRTHVVMAVRSAPQASETSLRGGCLLQVRKALYGAGNEAPLLLDDFWEICIVAGVKSQFGSSSACA